MAEKGTVYLIGAGPGDPDLLTVRGLQLLRRADVVIYDRLVNRALLEEVPAWAETIFAGKAPGRHALRQEAINDLLVDRAQTGRVVIRLKGGDPFVFGRGGEEAIACAEAGVHWEVVPGVTSAAGVPARAGIPVTHRQVAGSFAVVTAHRCDGTEAPDWAALARIDTLIILMGVGQLPRVVANLLAQGRAAGTPAAIIERGTLPEERVVVATLGSLEEAATQASVRPPATIVVGDVVALREHLRHVTPEDGSADAGSVTAPALAPVLL